MMERRIIANEEDREVITRQQAQTTFIPYQTTHKSALQLTKSI